MSIIYGVDTDKPIKSADVRDAVVECFTQAHREALADIDQIDKDASQEEIEQMKRVNVRQIVRSMFEKTGGNFDQPTKDSLIKCCEELADYAKSFRNPEIIKKHYEEIMELVNKL